MLKPEEPRFSDDEEQRPLLAEKELRDACLYAAAIIVVATRSVANSKTACSTTTAILADVNDAHRHQIP